MAPVAKPMPVAKPSKRPASDMDLMCWLVQEGGLSSATIIGILRPKLRRFAEAFARGIGCYPLDSGDFGRCVAAMDMMGVPHESASLATVSATFGDGWAKLVPHWAELHRRYVEEAEGIHGGRPQLSARIRALLGRLA